MSDHRKSLLRLSVAALALVALVGCGLKGGLERPPPQFGEARAAYEAEQKAKAEAAAAEQAKKEREAKERQRMTIPAPSTSAQPSVENPSQPAPQ
ncbi:MAG: hypothetical protein JNM47_03460 [Hyphomonadaceae bacterium]|nr:hypothetical protein [Hyphomonadaceae bacterium]